MGRITIDQRLFDLFDRYLIERNAMAARVRFRIGEVLRYKPTGTVTEAYTRHPPGLIMSLGAMTHVVEGGGDLLHMKTGRYCSIARNVSVANGNHPMHAVTTNPFHYHQYYLDNMPEDLRYTGAQQPFTRSYGMVTVGHDVWIGANALFKGGITVGHGAVVAMGSVVTKDIPPYAIVGGNPAKIIRYRFPHEIIQGFLECEWWSFHPQGFKHLNMNNPEEFLREFWRLKESGDLEVWRPPRVEIKDNEIREI